MVAVVLGTDSRLNSDERSRIGALWCESALQEHSSIASFGDFLRDAMLVGAPPDFLRRIIRAMNDELRHAQICFNIAREIAGIVKGPGDFPLLAGVKRRQSVEEILSAVIVEGCIGETVAAAYLESASEQAASPALAQVLKEIASDEAEHGALAWDFVKWLLNQRPDLWVIGQKIFEGAFVAPLEIEQHALFCDSAARFGHLDFEHRLAVRRNCLATRVRPAFERLFNTALVAAN